MLVFSTGKWEVNNCVGGRIRAEGLLSIRLCKYILCASRLIIWKSIVLERRLLNLTLGQVSKERGSVKSWEKTINSYGHYFCHGQVLECHAQIVGDTGNLVSKFSKGHFVIVAAKVSRSLLLLLLEGDKHFAYFGHWQIKSITEKNGFYRH